MSGWQPGGKTGAESVPRAATREMPGRQALLLAALTVGVLMLGIQLWLLTVALEMYLSGEGDAVWGLAIVSGSVFGGSLLASWLLSRRPKDLHGVE